jgi:hypothetical protein
MNANLSFQNPITMKFQKILTWFLILGSFLGILLSADYSSYEARLTSLIVFSVSLAFGVWYARSAYVNKQILLLLFLALQVFSFSTVDFNCAFTVGLGYINYFEISTLKHHTSIVTSSYINFWDAASNRGNYIGINLVPIIMICLLLFFRRKSKMQGYVYRNEIWAP